MGLLNSLFSKKENKIVEYLNKKAILLDVRTVSEFNNKSINGAKHIPLNMLYSHLKELKNETVHTLCIVLVACVQKRQQVFY